MLNIFRISKILIIGLLSACTFFLLFRYDLGEYFETENIRPKLFTIDQKIDYLPVIAKAKTKETGKAQTQSVPTEVTQHSIHKPDDLIKLTSINTNYSVWSKIGDQLKLDHHTENPRVKKEIKRILSDKKSFETILNHSAPFVYYIFSQTEARHLPAEITLIPIIESEYNPFDHNRVGATGLWQIMPQTARELGMKIYKGIDGRWNVIPATNAALTFLNDLKGQFKNNWNLVFAAYNCGPGCVSKAVRRAHTSDFFRLNVPLDTRYYVPRLLAIAEILKHPKQYGITLPPIANKPYFNQLKVSKAQSLQHYAKSTGIHLDVLKKLNPNYRNGKTIPRSSTILVPIQT